LSLKTIHHHPPSIAITFVPVPASPIFQGTYQDAKGILYTERISVDSIGDVISNGNIEEAGFNISTNSTRTKK